MNWMKIVAFMGIGYLVGQLVERHQNNLRNTEVMNCLAGSYKCGLTASERHAKLAEVSKYVEMEK